MPVNSFENYPMTWKPNKEQLTTPLYLSIANLLEYDIVNAYLAPNTKLPPQRELADYLDINLSTITRAFKICELKGLIYAKTGKGTFVAPNAGSTISIIDSEIEKNCIEMSVIKPFDQFNQAVLELTKNILSKGYLEKLLDYSHPLGSPSHKIAARNWLRKYHVEAATSNIAITSGAQNAACITLISLFHSGDKIAVDRYTYPNFIELANMLNIQLIPISGDLFGMKADELDMQCKLNNIQGIYLTPSCNNPTAILMNASRKQEIAKVIKDNKLILIEDDIFSFLTPPDTLPITYFVPEQSIYISSVSKALCSGIRVGFMCYPEKYKSSITRGIYNIHIKTPSLNAEIITELINTGIADQIVLDKRTIAKERNDIYKKYFDIENPNENPLSFFRWLPLKQRYNPNAFEKNALEKGIKIYHSNRFSVGHVEEKQFLRVALSSIPDANELDRGLALLKSILSEPSDPSNNHSLII